VTNLDSDRGWLDALETWLSGIDRHLDAEVGQRYKDEPLAQDWARVTKVSEEVGEAIAELILWTQQNPRKVLRGDTGSESALLKELADVVITGALGIQHFTKDARETLRIIEGVLHLTYLRIEKYDRDKADNGG
jgi:uncharacterized protein (DUF924 family)